MERPFANMTDIFKSKLLSMRHLIIYTGYEFSNSGSKIAEIFLFTPTGVLPDVIVKT